MSLGEFARVEIDPGSCTTFQLDGRQGAISGYAYAEAMMLAT